MNDFTIDHFVESLQMRNLERADRFNGEREASIGAAVGILLDALSRRTKDAQNARAVEPLAFTVVAEAHEWLPSGKAQAAARPAVLD